MFEIMLFLYFNNISRSLSIGKRRQPVKVAVDIRNTVIVSIAGFKETKCLAQFST